MKNTKIIKPFPFYKICVQIKFENETVLKEMYYINRNINRSKISLLINISRFELFQSPNFTNS